MANKTDLPLVSGNLESLILDIQESWGKFGWIFVVFNVILAVVVISDVARKRLK